jgi:spore coat protein U-like protein
MRRPIYSQIYAYSAFWSVGTSTSTLVEDKGLGTHTEGSKQIRHAHQQNRPAGFYSDEK